MPQRSPDIHVVPSIDGWAVKRDGDETAVSRYRSEDEAVEAGRALARSDGVGFLLFDTSGGVRERESYGEDTSDGG